MIDEAIGKKIKTYDIKSMLDVYDRFYGFFMRLAKIYYLPVDEVEPLYQQAMRRVWNESRKYKKGFIQFVFRICRQCLKNAMQNRQIEQRHDLIESIHQLDEKQRMFMELYIAIGDFNQAVEVLHLKPAIAQQWYRQIKWLDFVDQVEEHSATPEDGNSQLAS